MVELTGSEGVKVEITIVTEVIFCIDVEWIYVTC